MNMRTELKKKFHEHILNLQDEISAALRVEDQSIELIEDLWEREDFEGKDGGGGRTRAFRGEVIENAGVNTSLVHGKIDPKFAANLGGTSNDLWACGISLIIHPKNPRVPTTHANFRMIECGDKIWFGGGADLTPFYPHEEDFIYFHKVWKDACTPFGVYEDFKQQCDEYFVNKHRDNEMRGISGVFFDHFNSGDLEKDAEMVTSLSKNFIESYFPIVTKRKDEAYTQEDEEFQLYRRGRYVEFNLLHDRGTMFGLKTNGRTESILISLPARCRFGYKYTPAKGSPHAKMLEYYRPKDWV